MSVEIRKLIDGDVTVYPLTVGEAVSLEDGSTVQDLADAFEDLKLLSVSPTIRIFKSGTREQGGYSPSDVYLRVEHPLQNIEGSELVLMKYASNNYKKTQSSHQKPKKGWCVAAGRYPAAPVQDSTLQPVLSSNLTYFVFPKNGYVTLEMLNKYLLNRYPDPKGDYDFRIKNPGGFGIALRVPNPAWTLAETINHNGIRRINGTKITESLWSDVRRIRLDEVTSQTYPFKIGFI